MADEDFSDDSDNSNDFNNAAYHHDHSNFFGHSDSDDDFDDYYEELGCASDDACRQKSKRFKSLRKKVHWEVEEERRKFQQQLYVLIEQWYDRLPDLQKYFRREEMDWLLAQDFEKNSPFGRFPLIRFVIRCGYKDEPKVNEDGVPLTRRTTPLHRAARRKYYRLVPMLFEIYDRYDVNYVDERGLTHFHVACLSGRDDAVKRFLELGQDPKRLVDEADASGAHPPLHLALFRGHEEVAKLLLKAGADPNLANNEGLTPLHVLARSKRDDDGSTKLFFEINDELKQAIRVDARNRGSARQPQDRTAVTLLRRGADPNLAQSNGQTPLHVICEGDGGDDDEKATFVRTFLVTCRELDRPVHIDARGFMDWTPLQLAASSLLPNVVNALLDHGADLSNFAFPDEFYVEREYERYYGSINWFISYLSKSYGVLAVVECLENRGYQFTRANALAIMNFFHRQGLFGIHRKKRWYDDTRFARVAKEQSVRPGLTLYDLVRLSPEEAAKLLTHKDYYEFARETQNWLPPGWPTVTCALHLCENMLRGFFRRWALEPLQELTRCELPILCCEKIIDELGNKDLFRMYLAAASPARLHCEDEDGKPLLHCYTPLHHKPRNSEIANDLFKIYSRYDVNYIDKESGYTHFHAACQYGCYDVVEQFLELGQNPNFPAQKSVDPPLHLAARNQHMNVFELLLKHGADKNSRNRSGQTILNVIVQFGDFNGNAKLLFDTNKEQTVQVVDVRDGGGRTPLQMAVVRFWPHLVDLLLDNGADLSSFAFLTDYAFLNYFESIHYHLYSPGAKAKKVSAMLKTVEFLEKGGYKLKQSDALIIMGLLLEHKMCKKQLYWFYRCWNDRSVMEKAKKIMITPKLSAYHLTRLSPYEVEKFLTDTDYLELVPVIQKIWYEHTDYKDEPEIDEDGKPLLRRTTPVHYLAGRERFEWNVVISSLFQIYDRFDVNCIDEESGYTHFHAACEYGRRDIMEKFLELAQVDPNWPVPETGDSPLHLALRSLQDGVCELLLRHGADPNSANKKGCTPLHLLVEYEDEWVKTFFEIIDEKDHHPVQIDARDNFGETPLQCAVASLRMDVADVLLDRGADWSSFVFPTERHFDEHLKNTFEIDERAAMLDNEPLNRLGNRFEDTVEIASGMLEVVECLEKRGYELTKNEALTVLKVSAKHELFVKSEHVEFWRNDEDFANEAKRLTIDPNVSLYNLIRLRPEEANKLLAYEDYHKFARSLIFKIRTELREPCAAYLCEMVTRGFCRRWALEFFFDLTRQQLPILCCEIIIEQLMNEDLLGVSMATAMVANEQSKNIIYVPNERIILLDGNKWEEDYARVNCEKIFGSEINLIGHQDAVHRGREDLTSKKCESKFEHKSTVLRHQKIADGVRKNYACNKCEKRFGQIWSMLWHQKISHEGRQDFECDNCKKKFGHKQYLLVHQRTVHEGRKDYPCDKCELKFGQKSSLIKHINLVHEGRKDYVCEKCEKKFGQKWNLIMHQKTVHEGRKDYACDMCEKKFGFKSHLLSHKKTFHEGCKDYACDKCDKIYGERSNLLKHQKTVHEGRKDYACHYCEKKFGHKSNLIMHQKTTHEGRKDYACAKCEKVFGQKSHMLQHQRTAHEGLKDYVCEKCEKKFGQKSNLIMHQKLVHEGRRDFSCDKCEKKFGKKSTLLRHQETVHKDNPSDESQHTSNS
ncbi:unnamed protein product [Trichogramma brassicae]|uniref:C2H2-type domain-containing protein n=1 Tax=Trichogramma brassicae TaxID=86971 RepID=A0A6H5J210_9HYME|nr:unnamed protein product [Trichogramma brassicae]